MNRYMHAVESFGEVVKQMRLQANLSQAQIADNTGLDRTYISMLERGIRYPSLETICKLACSFQLKPSDLIRFCEKTKS